MIQYIQNLLGNKQSLEALIESPKPDPSLLPNFSLDTLFNFANLLPSGIFPQEFINTLINGEKPQETKKYTKVPAKTSKKSISDVDPKNCFALVIGVDYVKIPNLRLNGCCTDAYNTKEMLLSRFGFLNENITILTDDNPTVTKEPTTPNVEAALKALADKAKKGDAKFIVITYSGHGTTTPDNADKDYEIDGTDECWVFPDYVKKGLFKDDRLRTLFLDKLGSGVDVVIISDSCHSGSMCDLSFTYRGDNNLVVDTKTKVDNLKPNVWQISGCMDEQYSEELEINGKVSGALTYCMTQFFTKGKKVRDIMKESNDKCRSLKVSQIPVLSCNKKELLDATL